MRWRDFRCFAGDVAFETLRCIMLAVWHKNRKLRTAAVEGGEVLEVGSGPTLGPGSSGVIITFRSIVV